MSSSETPLASLARTISAWRSTLLKAETILTATPSASAAARSARQPSAAAGTSQCSRPFSPVSANTSSPASGCSTSDRAAITAREICSESSSAFTSAGHCAALADIADAPRHQRRAQDDDHDAGELRVDHPAQRTQSGGCHDRRAPLFQHAAPRHELHRRIDRSQPHRGEERELDDERDVVEIVACALLEIEHPQQADDEQ